MMRKREVAKRVFAYELVRSTYQIQEEDSPKYILTPTGERANRIFSVAVLLDKEEIGADTNFWRLRLADPTGTFYATVGRFQPEALEVVSEINVPELVAVVGKTRVFEGTSRKLVSLRPESIAVVDLAVRDYWVLETAKRTLERIEAMEKREGEDVELAWQIYNPDLNEYREMVKKALLTVKEDVEVMEKIEKAEEEGEEEEEFDFTEFEFEEEEFDLTDLLED
ncbi:MAG: hypothetical protein GXO67_03725 [Archaeoglobi archaeon]|nr:hypothetical protein [Archaeoglobi archaeon]